MNSSKRIYFVASLIALTLSTLAQEATKPSISFYGFIRNEMYYDTYKGLDVAMDQFYLLPLYVGEDSNGDQINNQGSAHLTAIATRAGMNITGPTIMGAKSSANIEYDFAGITGTEPVLIRIRKAYMKLSWEKSSLLIGQTWHPFWGGGDFPTVASLNTGAPFQTFNRSPQINYSYSKGNLTVAATALYENQYVSKGFYDATNSNKKTLPKRNAAIPEMVLSAKFVSNGFTLAAAGQYNTIKPIDVTTGTTGRFITKEMNTSMAAMAYVQYKKDKLKILAKTTIGQNMANLTMLGGYGAKSYDPETGAMEYTNYNHQNAYLNIVYGKKHQVGLFVGYSKNLGTNEELHKMFSTVNGIGLYSAKTAGLLTGFGTNVQQMTRIAPHFAYNVNKFRFVAEYELTSASYGIGEFNYSNGLYKDTKSVTNNRIIFVMMYFF